MNNRKKDQQIISNLGFLLIYGIPIIPVLVAWFGTITPIPNILAFLPLLLAYGLVGVMQALFPYQIQSSPEAVSRGWQRYYRFLPLFSLPAQLLMLSVGAAYWSSDILNIWGKIGYLFSIGAYSAFFAINLGHELIHRSYHQDRFLGGVLLSTVGFGTFKVVHLRIHHPYVGTPFDFATAKRGQSIYHFWLQSLWGNFYIACCQEFSALAKVNKPFWQSELLVWYLFSLGWLGLAIEFWGWQGGLFFGLQSLIAIGQLDWINYLQHYGLTRKMNASGQYEPVSYHHAWSQGLFMHDWFLLNLFRHSDHHTNPKNSYQLLRHSTDYPIYPYQHIIMLGLSLMPPLFQRVVHPHLDCLGG